MNRKVRIFTSKFKFSDIYSFNMTKNLTKSVENKNTNYNSATSH